MQKLIMTLLVVTTAGIGLAASNAMAAQGRGGDHGPGHGPGDRTDLVITHQRERIVWKQTHGDCEFKKVRRYDEDGNMYLKRIRVCDRQRIVEY